MSHEWLLNLATPYSAAVRKRRDSVVERNKKKILTLRPIKHSKRAEEISEEHKLKV